MKLIFLSDFFYGDFSPEMGRKVVGGAEAHDEVLYMALKEKYDVQRVRCKDLAHSFVTKNSKEVWFITNFGFLDEQMKNKFVTMGINYFIYEHDHKYVMGRNPIVFPNFTAPEEYVTNQKFLSCARRVYVSTQLSMDLMLKNLRVKSPSNIENIHCNFFSDETFEKIQRLNRANIFNRAPRAFILKSDQQAKSHEPMVKYCDELHMDYDLVDQCDYDTVLLNMRTYALLVYFTNCVDTFCRLIAEANMLNCKVITDPKNMGIYSEKDLVKMKGDEMIDTLRTRRDQALDLMMLEIDKCSTS